ncbi:hypothetical protein ACFQ4M_10590 [Thauera mechernichensis]|uniref:Uncharacterized protein n=1 Tax=Thauera mechernichensis TaxID=82788 RepID=A0ABW3WDZ1_9RHOO|nr:hypothetical protein [Thauera mechernichensis]MDG3066954.1 hypothetical protein [Thauera mechernichensis]
MNQTNRTNLLIAFVAAICSLVGGLSGSYLTGHFLLKSTEAQVEKDIAVLSSQNAQKNLEKTQEKAEAFIVALHGLIGYFESNDRFVVSEAKAKVREAEAKAYALAPYVSPVVAAKGLEVCLALRSAVDSGTPNERSESLKKVVSSTAEWVKVYYEEVGKYQSQSMPEKWKYDLLGPLLGGLLKQ